MAWWGLIWCGLLALHSLETGALGSRQMWSFDKECQFSALRMLCVLKEGERTVILRRWDIGNTHHQSLHI